MARHEWHAEEILFQRDQVDKDGDEKNRMDGVSPPGHQDIFVKTKFLRKGFLFFKHIDP